MSDLLYQEVRLSRKTYSSESCHTILLNAAISLSEPAPRCFMDLPSLSRCSDLAGARVDLLSLFGIGIKGSNEFVKPGIWSLLPKSNENEASVVNSSSSVRASFKVKRCLPQTGLFVDLDHQAVIWRCILTKVE